MMLAHWQGGSLCGSLLKIVDTTVNGLFLALTVPIRWRLSFFVGLYTKSMALTFILKILLHKQEIATFN
jgi:hypothetical protein